MLGIEKDSFVLGFKPGEMLDCIHSKENPGGCGASTACRVCGTIAAIVESQAKNSIVAKEALISISVNGENHSFDFLITAMPFPLDSEKFTLVIVQDISDQKRRQVLERIFFHDILNSASAIYSFSELLTMSDDIDEIKTRLGYLRDASVSLLSQIKQQKILLEAENNELKLNLSLISIKELIIRFYTTYHQLLTLEDKIIKLELPDNDVIIKTDVVILERIFINLLKNAIEAISSNEEIKFGYYLTETKITFFVFNHTYIPEDGQLQIFMRTFSTKGSGRGIGTYSIKLLVEKYLQGRVWFESSIQNGTTFYVELNHT